MEYKDVRYDIELKAGWGFGYGGFKLGYKHDVSGVIEKIKEYVYNPLYGYQSTEKLDECLKFLNKVKIAVLQHKNDGNQNCNDIEYKDSLDLISCFVDEIEGYKMKWAIEEKQQTPEPQRQFTKTLSQKQQEYLYNKLTEGDMFMPKSDTDYSSFCYVFGGSIKPENFTPLKWMQNVQLLRELLKPLLITYKTQEFVIPPYFRKKKGEMINHLPGNNPKPNQFSGKISNIHKGLNQTL